MSFISIILSIVILGVLIIVHEFGHFIVAKANHIAVTEFSIGMGPAIFSVKKKETKYSQLFQQPETSTESIQPII